MLSFSTVFHSFIQALLSTACSALGGLLLAWLLVHTPRHILKTLFQESLLLFFMLPSLILGVSVLQVGRWAGWHDLYGLKGIVLCHTLLNAPFVARSLLQAYATLPAPLWREAQHLSLRPVLRFSTLEWPFLRTSLLHSASLVFCLCLSSFTIPLLLTKSFHMTSLSLALYNDLIVEADLGKALLYGLTFAILAAGMGLLERRLPTATCPPLQAEFQKKGAGVLGLLWVGLGGLFAFPLVIGMITFVSSQGMVLLGQERVLTALGTSLGLALTAGTLSTLLSLCLVLSLPPKGYTFFQGLSALFLLPSFVIGGLASLLSGLQLDLHPLKVTLVLHTLLPLPFGIRLLREPLKRHRHQNQKLIQVLRLSTRQTLFLVECSQMKSPLISVFALSVAFSLGDVGAPALLGGQLETLPTLVLEYLSSFNLDYALTLSYVLLGCMGIISLPLSHLINQRRPLHAAL